MAEISPTAVPFDEAIDYLRAKVRLPTRTWTDLWQGQHARAFVVAGATKAGLVADFHEAVTRAIAEGRTLADFRKDFDAIVARHGWTYKGKRGWRSAVIYNTNMRMAHSAGRWAQAQRLKARRPYLRYVATLDDRTRPDHRDWHGTVLPVDHEFWATHMPPNGWNCRCTVQSLSARDLERRGLGVTDPPPATPTRRARVNTAEGPVAIEVPEGIDPGFAYNPGEAAFGRGAERVAMERHGPFEELLAPGGHRPANPPDLTATSTAIRPGVRAGSEAELRQALRDAIGGDEAIFVDPTGERVSITQALADHWLERGRQLDGREAYLPFLREVIERPQEIWVGFGRSSDSGRVLMRRRYVRIFQLSKKRSISLITDLDGGIFSGFTFFPADTGYARRMRRGLRVYSDVS